MIKKIIISTIKAKTIIIIIKGAEVEAEAVIIQRILIILVNREINITMVLILNLINPKSQIHFHLLFLKSLINQTKVITNIQ